MLLVAINTSGRHGGVALCRAEQDSFETLAQQVLEGGTYSARLIPLISELLAAHSISQQQIGAFVVVSGPGSFTGLRVGIATVKGLCEVLHTPLVAISMLEAVAIARGPGGLSGDLKGHGFSRAEEHHASGALAAAATPSKSIVALDAGRGEAYVGEFELIGQRVTLVREYITKPASFADTVALTDSPVLTPDSKVADSLIADGIGVLRVEPVQASEIGLLGYRKLLSGEVTDPATLDANYIRRSDAELFSAPK